MATGGSAGAGKGGRKARRPCCGACRMTVIVAGEDDATVCLECEVPWDGSEVSEDHLPAELEQQIAAGYCTRQQAFEAFLRMDDLAEAAAHEEITVEQGAELVTLDGLAVIGKARPQ